MADDDPWVPTYAELRILRRAMDHYVSAVEHVAWGLHDDEIRGRLKLLSETHQLRNVVCEALGAEASRKK